ncbi:MAG: SpoIIE family protein phosphatase [Ruminococcus sp.]|nr:SpoIIE family protein phosphatase [Ruminococcus sp.]
MLKTKVSIKNRNMEILAGIILSFLIGFLLSDAKICGTISFVNVALAGASNPLSALAVLVGSLIKYVVTSSVHKNVIVICAVTLIIVCKLIFDENLSAKQIGIITAASVFTSGTVVAAVIGENFIKIVFYLVYSVLAGFSAGFIKIASDSLKHKRVIDLKSAISCAYAVVFVILTASFASFEIGSINIGRIIGVTVTLIAAYHYGYIGGILCGALTTCGAFLVSSEVGFPLTLLSVSGLLTGYLYKNSSAIFSIFFISINFIFLIILGLPSEIFGYMLEIIIAVAFFSAVSPFFSDKWILTEKNEKGISDIISSQMSFLASSISTVRNDSKKIAEYLKSSCSKSTEIETACDAVCTNCYNRLFCWYNNYEMTRQGFKKMSEMGDPSIEKIPYELEECLYKDKLALEFAKNYREKITAKLMDLRFSDSQKLLFEQIKITEEIISSASEKVDVRYSESISKAVKAKLSRYNYNAQNVIAYYNSQNRLLMELYFNAADAPKKCERICDLISDEVKLCLDFSEPVHSGREMRIRIYEKTPYELETYRASMCAENSQETGDSSIVFSDGVGNSYIVLSDGMGSGKNASLESRMVVSMFKRLIISGADYSSAIKLINSIMLTKSQDEAFATLDAVKINLDTCKLTVIKSGASATLIRHRNQVIKVSSPTFPIGIVEEADTFSRDFEFENGDIIIMLSDGISENEYHYIKELLLQSNNIKEIVSEICRKADVFSEVGGRDDVTVIGLRISETE